MQNVLVGCQDFCRVHVDDIIIYSKTYEEHMEHLRIVLRRLQDANQKGSRQMLFWRNQSKVLGTYRGQDISWTGQATVQPRESAGCTGHTST